MGAVQDDLLRRAVSQHKGKSWKRISEYFEDRTDVQCLHRWQKVLNPELVKGPWTKEASVYTAPARCRSGALVPEAHPPDGRFARPPAS